MVAAKHRHETPGIAFRCQITNCIASTNWSIVRNTPSTSHKAKNTKTLFASFSSYLRGASVLKTPGPSAILEFSTLPSNIINFLHLLPKVLQTRRLGHNKIAASELLTLALLTGEKSTVRANFPAWIKKVNFWRKSGETRMWRRLFGDDTLPFPCDEASGCGNSCQDNILHRQRQYIFNTIMRLPFLDQIISNDFLK